jgi:dTDP-4-amino-4,6-dideoxygalactose transaminase
MQIVSYPPGFIKPLLKKFKMLLEDGAVAEGRYCKEEHGKFIPGKHSIPVSSGGAAIFSLLAYQKYACGKTHVVIQSNTMRALYSIPQLLNMKISVADSRYEDFLAMDPNSLENLIAKSDAGDKTVVIYSVIGGFLAPSYRIIEKFCKDHGIPLLVDAAHAHFLAEIGNSEYADQAFSFYATKILPSGEGGLVTTASREVYEWVQRFLQYDRFRNELDVGLNMRASEIGASFIYTLMTEHRFKEHFVDHRKAVAEHYRNICIEKGIGFIDPTKALDYNGYKFIVLDPRESVLRYQTDLTIYPPTSGIFDTDVRGRKTSLPHWCPPTYSSLYRQFRGFIPTDDRTPNDV